MEYRALGATGLRVSALGFGGNALGRDRRRDITAETLRTIAAALDHGVTLFDTANSYVSGDSERLLGRALAGRRQDIVLCSKAGHGFWASLPVQRWVGPFNRVSVRNFRPFALDSAVTGSLRRLRTDHLDVLYLHNPPPGIVQDDDVLACVERMRSKGYIRFWGISCARLATADDAHRAIGRTGVAVVQIPTNALHMLHTPALARDAAARGVALVGRQPFGHGDLLARQMQPEPASESTPARLALAGALRLEGLASVLVGMRRYEHLRENVRTVTHLGATRES